MSVSALSQDLGAVVVIGAVEDREVLVGAELRGVKCDSHTHSIVRVFNSLLNYCFLAVNFCYRCC